MSNRNSVHRGTDPQTPVPLPFDVSPLLEASRPTLAAAAEINGRLCETMTAYNTECVGFLNRRLTEDLAMPQRFAACRTIDDVYAVYTSFFQRAAEHYQTEMQQLVKIGQSLSQEPLRSEPAGNTRPIGR